MASFTSITEENCDEFLSSSQNLLSVIFLDAPFTEEEQIVNQAIESLKSAVELKDKISIGLVNVEKHDKVATRLKVNSLPSIVCMYKGKEVKRVSTLEEKRLLQTIREELKKQELLYEIEDGDSSKLSEEDKLKEYLKKLVNRHKVMIFMKGSPECPRCGFSRQLMELLKEYDVKFETFDILLDETVRQGLKEFSDWPTFPQVYVKGEFIGGLDILKQLHQDKELEKTLIPDKD